jgi:hypothetical protein
MPGQLRGRLSSLFTRNASAPGSAVTQESLSPERRSLVSFQPVVRLLSTSMLASPRFPKAPPSPQLREGFDYTPLSGGRRVAPLRRLIVLASTVVPGRAHQLAFAGAAVLCGFVGGLLLAWSLGLL